VKHKNKGPSADVNMVFMLLMEFLALSDNEEEVVFSDQVAQLTLDPMWFMFIRKMENFVFVLILGISIKPHR
jgi:hypothetical protein